MNLLIVIPAYLPAHRYGGPVKSVHELARKLVELGVEVTVFTTNADGPGRLEVPLDRDVILDGVKIRYFSVEKPVSYFYSPSLAVAINQRVKHFDLVYISWLYDHPLFAAARACLENDVPYIVSPRGMLDKHAIKMKGFLKKKIYLNLFEKKHLKGATALHYTSHGEQLNAWESGWNDRSFVVYNGINLGDYSALPAPDQMDSLYPHLTGKKVVLFLGRVNYIKGLDLLAMAWPIVMQKVPDAHLVIAGPDDDDYGDKVRGWVREGGCEQNVTFTGMLLGQEKLAALSRADVFVASSWLESFGMAIVEAMACGKPVVITERVNICREVEDAKAGLVVPCESKCIAEAIVNMLQDLQRSQIMGRNGRRLVEEKFTWDQAAHCMLKIYQDILGRKIGGNT